MSRFFNKLPGYHRAESGMEWKLFKMLPKLFLGGSLFLFLVGYYFYTAASSSEPERLKVVYSFLGLFFSYWFLVGAAFIGCIVVIIMKGPAYVADGYKLPKEDPSKEEPLEF